MWFKDQLQHPWMFPDDRIHEAHCRRPPGHRAVESSLEQEGMLQVIHWVKMNQPLERFHGYLGKNCPSADPCLTGIPPS